jgi:hypothetical protein
MIACFSKNIPCEKSGKETPSFQTNSYSPEEINFFDKEKKLNSINSPFLLNTRNNPFGKEKGK